MSEDELGQNVRTVSLADDSPTRRRRRYLLFIPLLLALLGAGGYYGYQELRIHRFERFLAEAHSRFEAGEYERALQAAKSAHNMWEGDLESLRLISRCYEQTSPIKAYRVYRHLLDQGNASYKDLMAYLRLANIYGMNEDQAPYFKQLLKMGPDNAEAHALAARYLIQNGHIPQAIELLEECLRRFPDQPRFQLYFAQAAVRSKDPQDTDRAYQVLSQLSQAALREGVHSLHLMINRYHHASEDEIKLLMDLLAHPKSTDRDHIFAYNQIYKLNASYFEQLYTDALERLDLENAETKFNFLHWLSSIGQVERALTLINREEIFASERLLRFYLDGLLLSGDLEGVAAWVFRKDTPVPPFDRLLYQYRIHHAYGETAKAEDVFDRLLKAADFNAKRLWIIAKYFHAMGMTKQARAAYQGLTHLQAQQVKAFDQWILLEQQHGSTLSLIRALEQASEAFPRETAYRNDLLYLAILTDQNLAENSQKIADLLSETPGDESLTTSLALAMAKQGRHREALELYRPIEDRLPRFGDRWRSILAYVLMLNGHQNEAMEYLGSIDRRNLLKEEQSLFWY